VSEKWLLSPRLHFEFLQLLPRWYSAKSPQLSRKLRSSMLKQSCHTEYAKRKFDISFLKRGSVLKYNFYKYIKVIKMITLQINIKKFELFLSKISTSFQFHFFYSILSIIRSINIFSNSWDIQFIYKFIVLIVFYFLYIFILHFKYIKYIKCYWKDIIEKLNLFFSISSNICSIIIILPLQFCCVYLLNSRKRK